MKEPIDIAVVQATSDYYDIGWIDRPTPPYLCERLVETILSQIPEHRLITKKCQYKFGRELYYVDLEMYQKGDVRPVVLDLLHREGLQVETVLYSCTQPVITRIHGHMTVQAVYNFIGKQHET